MRSESRFNGAMLGRFQEALLHAFTASSLAQMVRYKLDENLEHIVSNADLAGAVFNLIRWAESNGKLEALLAASRAFNPGNPKLDELASSLLISPQLSAAPLVALD